MARAQAVLRESTGHGITDTFHGQSPTRIASPGLDPARCASSPPP
jgi:hypothetical protein